MPKLSKYSVITEKVSPKQAAAWLDHNYEYNRPLSRNHVSYLAREMALGRFTIATIHFMYVGNTVVLINGQHTLHAILESNTTQTCVVIRERDCTQEDLPSTFMHYDIHRKRTFRDSVRAFRLDEKMGVPDYFLNVAASAIKYGYSGFSNNSLARTAGAENQTRYLSVADLFEIVPKWEKEIKEVFSSIENGARDVTGVIRTSKVFSVALITAYYQPEKSQEFWRGVATDDGLSVGDPRKTLHKYLPRTVRNRLTMDHDSVPANVVTRSVTYCWNAYFEDRLYTRVSIKSDDVNKPLVIAGTPYSGNQHPLFWPTRNRDKAAA